MLTRILGRAFGSLRLRLVATVGVAAVLGGCASTISSVSLPSNVAWKSFATGILTPYSDLTATATGTGIQAEVEVASPIVLCNSSAGKYSASITIGVPPSSLTPTEQLALCVNDQPTGATNVSALGVFYQAALGILTADTFLTGGVEVSSTSAGTVYAVSFNKNSLGKLDIAAGVSPSVFGGSVANDGTMLNYSSLFMQPPEPSFASAALCADGTVLSASQELCPTSVAPSVACLSAQSTNAPFDVVAIYNGAAAAGTLTCGSIPLSISVTGGYKSLGECVDTNVKKFCTGLTGKRRSACNQAQAGACQATFNVPSALNPNK